MAFFCCCWSFAQRVAWAGCASQHPWVGHPGVLVPGRGRLGWSTWERGCGWCRRVLCRWWDSNVGAGDEDEKWGAGWELCLLQRKGLSCHGIFIPLWEM